MFVIYCLKLYQIIFFSFCNIKLILISLFRLFLFIFIFVSFGTFILYQYFINYKKKNETIFKNFKSNLKDHYLIGEKNNDILIY